MVSLHSKFADKGYRIVSVTAEDAPKVEAMIKDKSMNYFTALIDRAVVNEYGVRSWPTMYVLNDKCEVIRKGAASDQEIEGWVATLVPDKVDTPLTKATKKAGKAYEDRDFAKALEESTAVLAGEEVEAEDKRVADRIKELVGKQVQKANK
ncbi:MAG: redoxin domain-containing protein, partial [Planctomycetes bacterium]|nr:redoxin domain-containing protein [Planctomycetota bacterium]